MRVWQFLYVHLLTYLLLNKKVRRLFVEVVGRWYLFLEDVKRDFYRPSWGHPYESSDSSTYASKYLDI